MFLIYFNRCAESKASLYDPQTNRTELLISSGSPGKYFTTYDLR